MHLVEELPSCAPCMHPGQYTSRGAVESTIDLLRAAAAGPSRFAFSAAVEEEAPKPSNVQRGKDGHISLGGGSGDFFSDPMSGAAPAKSRR